RPVSVDRGAVEVSGVDLVESGLDHDWHLPAVEGDLDRLLRAKKPGCDGEINTEVAELCVELARLLPSAFGQRDRARRITAERVCDIRPRRGVARKDEQATGRTQPGGGSTPPARAPNAPSRWRRGSGRSRVGSARSSAGAGGLLVADLQPDCLTKRPPFDDLVRDHRDPPPARLGLPARVSNLRLHRSPFSS